MSLDMTESRWGAPRDFREEGAIHLQLNKQLEAERLPPASAVTNTRWMKIAVYLL